MDTENREDRDRLETFRRKLLGSADVPAASAGGIPIDIGWDVGTLVAAQGKLVAMVAMLLDRERILKASEPGSMFATIASVTPGRR
ncbi:hypothetical protein [uncultured Sphingomonas sp.]|uniref:hypothetical protein n=1 Tax=uncultured Sphingomonas sp. TaxID=158754 RepID=UPI0030D9BC05